MHEINLSETITALDLGTTKFCLAHFDGTGKKLHSPLRTLSVDADGMRRGMLSDLEKARKALLTLTGLSEQEFQRPVHRVVVGVAGSHLKSDFIVAEIKVPNQKIQPCHLKKLEKEAMRSATSFEQVSLHTIPVAYRPDNREWIQNPVGFSGDRLAGRFFRMTADRHYVSDLISLCNQCGLEVSSLYAEPYASSMVTTGPGERRDGAVLADIGGGTTDGIIFHSGQPVRLFTINIGGVMMTRDLSLGLNIPYQHAEQIKFSQGLSGISHQSGRAGLSAGFILKARVHELGLHLRKEISSAQLPGSSGLFLTGGGSGVLGISSTLQSLLNMPVRVILPNPEKPVSDYNLLRKPDFSRLQSGKFATVSGMLILELLKALECKSPVRRFALEKYVRQFFSWVREFS